MKLGDEIRGDRGVYRVLDQIGAGGMGRVYRGEDIASGAIVAVKTVLSGLDDKLVRRFHRETALLANVKHPNVVRYVDSGAAPDPFVVTEFIPGDPLTQVIGERALRQLKPVAVRWALELAGALAAVHAEKIIHRDIKPSNVVIDGAERAVLIDFGLARADGVTRLTATDEVLGTLAYMAPEIYENRPATPATDVYGWGLIAFELLARHRPHPDLDPMFALEERRTRAPEVPARGGLEALAAIVQSCLAPDPQHRPRDGKALLARLEREVPAASQAEESAEPPPPAPPPSPDVDSPEYQTQRLRGDEVAGQITSLGTWDIVRQIGKGGMGAVYEGRGRTSKERVAIKVVAEGGLRTPADRERFDREARILVGIDSPRIVKVLDIGEEKGRPYIVMQYLEGEDLAQRLARAGPQSLERTLDLAIAIVEGVSELHAKGIVHRDLKPSNIMVTPRGGPRLVDFGLARAPADERVTKTGQFLGTIEYSAPEAMTGKTPTPAADVFSIGLILFEILTRTRGGRRADARDRLRDALSGRPELGSPPGMMLRELLLDTVARCTEVEVRARFPDAAALLRPLKQVRQDLAKLQAPAKPTPVAGKAAAPAPDAPAKTGALTWVLLIFVTLGAVGMLAILPELLKRSGLR